MSNVAPEEVATVLTEARNRYEALKDEVDKAKNAVESNSSPETFRAYFKTHAEFGRQELRLSLLKKWAVGFGLEVAA